MKPISIIILLTILSSCLEEHKNEEDLSNYKCTKGNFETMKVDIALCALNGNRSAYCYKMSKKTHCKYKFEKLKK